MLTSTGSQQATIAFAFDSESGNPHTGQTSADVPESSSLPDETVFENEDSKMTFGGRTPTIPVKNSEIDVATSGQDDMVYDNVGEILASQENKSQNVLYEPEISMIPSLSNSKTPQVVAEQRKINLAEAITLSRQTDALFNVNKTFSAEVHVTES